MSVQFYGYNFGGTGVFNFFSAFMHSFQKFVSEFPVIFKPYTLEETVIENVLHLNDFRLTNECER